MSIRHWPKRACTQMFVAWLLPSIALAAVADTLPAPSATVRDMVAALAAYTVTLAGGIVLAYLRWLRNVGENVQRKRDDGLMLARIDTNLSSLRREQEQTRKSVDHVGERVDALGERIANLEGRSDMLPCMRGQTCPPAPGR